MIRNLVRLLMIYLCLLTLYDIRPDKQGFVNRMNNLTPIEWTVPLGLPIFFGEEQENK